MHAVEMSMTEDYGVAKKMMSFNLPALFLIKISGKTATDVIGTGLS